MMGRKPCCAEEDLNKGAWTEEEDRILKDYVKSNGEGRWRSLPNKAGLRRCGKSCRLRWLNYLRPDIKRGNITLEEEDLIIRLHKLLGNKWSLIAGRLPGRTDNEIKNYWNTYLRKKIQNQQQTEEIVHLPEISLRQKADQLAGREAIKELPMEVDEWWNFSEGWLDAVSGADFSSAATPSELSSLNYLYTMQESYDGVLEEWPGGSGVAGLLGMEVNPCTNLFLGSSDGWQLGEELFRSNLEWYADDEISHVWEW